MYTGYIEGKILRIRDNDNHFCRDMCNEYERDRDSCFNGGTVSGSARERERNATGGLI